ncbi:hypothetical protein NP493_42g04015 [Ridgeia piscesae]|uniref:Uncharacterized protein n=1 Tax=Ridgeia piscesae TaxID=27915 RepID=A0AAD9PBT3_RIDPI|nr:hypothetical protein NP493_42g04015 [Ridgeia piscesae]
MAMSQYFNIGQRRNSFERRMPRQRLRRCYGCSLRRFTSRPIAMAPGRPPQLCASRSGQCLRSQFYEVFIV